ncbi:MAG: Fe-S cluster assembly protein SufD [Bacteroidetes bacterium]|nr:Fe-S cluster assembly protein SufD [Flavobacteriales bacterium]NOG56370.1 Fe-S cluster assembly protein SufD [Bacteroidota bacterium]
MNETLTLSTKDQFLAHFERLDFSFDADFSKEKRKKAKSFIDEMEFPTSKTEYWKYTRINKIIKGNYQVNFPENEIEIDLAVPSKNCIVLVNGYYNEALSWFDKQVGVTFSSLSQAKETEPILKDKFDSIARNEHEIFTAINTAYHQDGAFLHVEKNVKVEESFYVVNIVDDSNVLAHPRNFFYLESGSEANVVLKTISMSTSSSFTNMVSEIFVDANAFLELNKIQDEQEGDYQIANEQVRQLDDSRFKINTFTLNGALVRNNLNIELLGKNIETWLNGLYPLKGKQHVDNHTYVLHQEPNCVSHELYKGILDDQSTGVFNGKVFVYREAQKTNAYQSNANMVLTDNASAYSKPELEIYADDVKCSHGSVTGQLDEEAMFYLRSRGMSEKSSRAVLLNAFASDVVEHIGVEAVKTEIEAFIDRNYQSIK